VEKRRRERGGKKKKKKKKRDGGRAAVLSETSSRADRRIEQTKELREEKCSYRFSDFSRCFFSVPLCLCGDLSLGSQRRRPWCPKGNAKFIQTQ